MKGKSVRPKRIVDKARVFIEEQFPGVGNLNQDDWNDRIHTKAWGDAMQYMRRVWHQDDSRIYENAARQLFDELLNNDCINENYIERYTDFITDGQYEEYAFGVWQKLQHSQVNGHIF